MHEMNNWKWVWGSVLTGVYVPPKGLKHTEMKVLMAIGIKGME